MVEADGAEDVGGLAQPEVDEGVGAGARNHVAFAHGRAARDGDRAEVQQRRRVAGRGLDGDRLAAVRHRARKRDSACGRRPDRRSARGRDFDAAVLAGGVRVVGIEREPARHRTVDRPRPRGRRGRQRQNAEHYEQKSPHHYLLRCQN